MADSFPPGRGLVDCPSSGKPTGIKKPRRRLRGHPHSVHNTGNAYRTPRTLSSTLARLADGFGPKRLALHGNGRDSPPMLVLPLFRFSVWLYRTYVRRIPVLPVPELIPAADGSRWIRGPSRIVDSIILAYIPPFRHGEPTHLGVLLHGRRNSFPVMGIIPQFNPTISNPSSSVKCWGII